MLTSARRPELDGGRGIVSLVAAGFMLILSVLGFLHLRRTPAEAELLHAGQRA
jgi:hypothetical protein